MNVLTWNRDRMSAKEYLGDKLNWTTFCQATEKDGIDLKSEVSSCS